MTRILGVFLMVIGLYAVLMSVFPEEAFNWENHQTLARRLGFYGVLTLGVGVLIVSGGIDLSIGSLVGLGAVCYALLLDNRGLTIKRFGLSLHIPLSPMLSAGLIVLGGTVVGLFHGVLITRLRLQAFLVTLCGLFMYRGLARWMSNSSVGLPGRSHPDAESITQLQRLLVSGDVLGLPSAFGLLILLAAMLAVLLHGSVYGRYMMAVGANEQAARYAGIQTDRSRILAYVICSTCAGLGGVLYLLEYRAATPSQSGSLLELYAITGAVLGGCVLRGGEGTIPGMLLGAAVLPMLSQICTFSPAIGSDLEYTVIGAALLLGTIGNELVNRRSR